MKHPSTMTVSSNSDLRYSFHSKGTGKYGYTLATHSSGSLIPKHPFEFPKFSKTECLQPSAVWKQLFITDIASIGNRKNVLLLNRERDQIKILPLHGEFNG